MVVAVHRPHWRIWLPWAVSASTRRRSRVCADDVRRRRQRQLFHCVELRPLPHVELRLRPWGYYYADFYANFYANRNQAAAAPTTVGSNAADIALVVAHVLTRGTGRSSSLPWSWPWSVHSAASRARSQVLQSFDRQLVVRPGLGTTGIQAWRCRHCGQ